MSNISDIIGKSVQSSEDGSQLGKVVDVVLDESAENVLGFVTKEKTLLNPAKLVPIKDVSQITSAALVVESAEKVVTADTDPILKSATESKTQIGGKELQTSDGTTLGTVQDLTFDATTGQVQGIRTKPLPVSSPPTKGGVLSSLKEKALSIKEATAKRTEAKKETSILGKPATRTVLDLQDNVLLKSGQPITHAAILAAKKAGVEDLLIQAGEGN